MIEMKAWASETYESLLIPVLDSLLKEEDTFGYWRSDSLLREHLPAKSKTGIIGEKLARRIQGRMNAVVYQKKNTGKSKNEDFLDVMSNTFVEVKTSKFLGAINDPSVWFNQIKLDHHWAVLDLLALGPHSFHYFQAKRSPELLSLIQTTGTANHGQIKMTLSELRKHEAIMTVCEKYQKGYEPSLPTFRGLF